MIYLRPDFRFALGDHGDPFEAVMALQGEVIRERNGRRTLRFELDGRGYFLKAHFGVGWIEILKNLSQLRLPVVGARNEWQAIKHLQSLGVATTPLVGYGIRGINPASLRSFVITEALPNTTTLAVFCEPWEQQPPRSREELLSKRALIRSVAEVARRIHENGLNHRDFYLCHLRLGMASGGGAMTPEHPRLYLMDLHRAQVRGMTPRRWIIKDIGSLYFSAMGINLSRRDLFRFMRHYRNKPLRRILQREKPFWQAVQRRAYGLYRPYYGKEPPSVGC